MNNNNTSGKNVYQIVTDKIIAKLEQGVIPWRRPWNASYVRATSWATGKAYRGINRLLLDPGEYLTFNQVKALGGHVRKGERASVAVFYKHIVKESESENGETEIEAYNCLRYYSVFEVGQCEGVNRKLTQDIERYDHDGIPAAEKVVKEYFDREYSPYLEIGAGMAERAFYNPMFDRVHLPALELYAKPEEYYSTAFHEMTHSTGAVNRLNRLKNGGKKSGSYAYEELIAELGASMLCNECRIDNTLDNSAAYIASWLSRLKNDSRMIITASAYAQKAADYILGRTEDAEDADNA